WSLFFFSSRRRHTRFSRDWSSDVCSSDLSADLLGRTHGEIAKLIKPGVRTIELDHVAETFIRDHGGTPSFKNYNGFPWSLCISVNDVVVHGFPGQYTLREGDIITIDCGVNLHG